jgi:hypothetical protein
MARKRTTPPPAAVEPDPSVPTGRQLITAAQAIGREADLYYHVHISRWPHSPRQWTEAQRRALAQFLDRFIRPDGTPQPVPHRRKR